MRTQKTYTELFQAMNSHVEFHLEFRTDFSSDSVSIALPVIDAFIISVRHSLSWAFVTSTMNCMIFLGPNKITCALKLKRLHKQRTVPLRVPEVLITSKDSKIRCKGTRVLLHVLYQYMY